MNIWIKAAIVIALIVCFAHWVKDFDAFSTKVVKCQEERTQLMEGTIRD